MWLRWVRALLALALIGGTLAVAGLVGLFWHFGRELPEIRNAEDYQPVEVSRVLAADGSVLATWIGDDALVRTVVPFEEIPQIMRDAILAAEDASFYEHQGIDYIGVLRAALINVRRGTMSQGASTITQQVVKNLVLSPERSIRRKVQEMILAVRLEQRLSKDELLTMYLNEVFFGSRYYGVEEASRYYFGHGVSEITLAEAATLAGIVQSPNRYNPFRHPERALERRAYVLRQLWEKGFIEESRYRAAVEEPLALDPTHGRGDWEGQFPFYVDAVRRELLEHYTEEELDESGLRIETALDTTLQSVAVDALRGGLRAYDARHGFHTPFDELRDDQVADWRRDHAEDVDTLGLRAGTPYRAVVLSSDDEATRLGIGEVVVELDRAPLSRLRPDERPWGELFEPNDVFTVTPTRSMSPQTIADSAQEERVVRLLESAQGAIVVIEPLTRRVLALTGGYDFARSSFNRAVQAERQVGSAFKPFVYAAALDARVATAGTSFLDQPVTFPMPNGETWQPRNYDGEYLGSLSLREALARSRNVVAVRVLDLVGLERAHAFAENAGITAPLTDNLTLALGSAEMTPLEATNGMATFAAGGFRGRPVFVTRVRDRTGDLLYQGEASLDAGIDPAVAWLTTSMMRSVVTDGTARRARSLEHPVVGKTGTTNGARDAWFLGFSRHLVAGVWVGRDDNGELGRRETGGGTALPIWVDFMERAHADREVLPFPEPPSSVEIVRIDPESGLRARPGQVDGRDEYFLAGTAPRTLAPRPDERSVDDVLLGDGRRAEPSAEGSGEGLDPLDGF